MNFEGSNIIMNGFQPLATLSKRGFQILGYIEIHIHFETYKNYKHQILSRS